MSLLYSSSFKHQDGEFRKNQEFMELNHLHYHQAQRQHYSGLTSYRSAPSSFLETLVNGISDHSGGECEDFRSFKSSSPEMDSMLARFILPSNSSGDSNSHNLQEYGERAVVMKQEIEDSHMVYQSLPANNTMANYGNSMNVSNSMDVGTLMNSMQETKMNPVNEFNLVRQNSSPAGFFSNQGVENGFTITKDIGGFRVSNGLNTESSPSTGRLNNHVNFSSGRRLLPQIDETGEENPSSNSSGSNIGKRQYMNFDSWDNSKRLSDNTGNVFSGLKELGNQNGISGNRGTALAHHLSLPKTASEIARIEKFLQFQGSPCKIRAKRGCATHPRSIAERVRRTRISERMRKLQDLFPNLDKQTNTADMLDLAVENIKDLQKQVETLSDTRSRCTCSSLQKIHPNSSA